jgi:hypothetical protein
MFRAFTLSSSGGDTQTALGILCACYFSRLDQDWSGTEFHSNPGSSVSTLMTQAIRSLKNVYTPYITRNYIEADMSWHWSPSESQNSGSVFSKCVDSSREVVRSRIKTNCDEYYSRGPVSITHLSGPLFFFTHKKVNKINDFQKKSPIWASNVVHRDAERANMQTAARLSK